MRTALLHVIFFNDVRHPNHNHIYFTWEDWLPLADLLDVVMWLQNSHKKLRHFVIGSNFIGIMHVILVRLENVWHCDDHLSGLTSVMSTYPTCTECLRTVTVMSSISDCTPTSYVK